MRNTDVRAAGGAMPAARPLTRRSILSGVAAAPALTLPAAVAATSQASVATRLRALATEMSQLLAELNGARWQVQTLPARGGVALFEIREAFIPAQWRLEQALTMASNALDELQPGAWRIAESVATGVVVITNDSWSN